MYDRIFLVTDKKKIPEVYNIKLISEIDMNLTDDYICDKDDVMKNPFAFKDIKYIFSTWDMPEFTEEEIGAVFPKLEAVFYAAGTVKYFAEPFLKKGIKVFSAAKANGIPVAEFTVAQIILANKGYFQSMSEYRKELSFFSYRRARKIAVNKHGNYDAKIGIIGGGTIGRKVVELLKHYKLDIYVSDPFVSEEEITKWGATKVDLKDIFKECDIISNHLPDIPDTQDLINYSLLKLMKNNATFINTGRGRQVVDKDLVKVMREKPNACALLDVTRHEPLIPFHCLRHRKNIFISPHISGSLQCENQRLAEFIIDAYKDYINATQNQCEVTLSIFKNKA